MLDNKTVGIKIASLRRAAGYSQEKLAEMLCITPQAVSKWENGHTLPETSLLPVLSQIFGCSIDDIIMTAYSFDKKIEKEKPTIIEQQAEHIAKRVINKMESSVKKKDYIGLSDDEIAEIIQKSHFVKDFTIQREKESRADGRISTKINIISSQIKLNLIELIYHKKPDEFYGYAYLNGSINEIPNIYHIDYNRKLILLDDLSDGYFRGFDFDKDNENGIRIRKNYNTILKAVANLHAAFWEDKKELTIPWHFETKEHVLSWIYDAMEKPYKKYRKSEDSGKIPNVWEGDFSGTPFRFENHITNAELDYFSEALNYLKSEYPKYVDERFSKGKNITVIHGDLHPGQMLMSKHEKRDIVFTSLQNIRQGLCTEDLAMLIALHLEPDKKKAEPLLEYYYNCLCEKVKGYSHNDFIKDYKLSVAENIFFTLCLINQGIYDFNMRDRAIKAFETFVLDKS